MELGAAHEHLAQALPPPLSAHHRQRAAALYNAAVTVRPYYQDGLPHKRLAEALLRVSPDYLPGAIAQMRSAIRVNPHNPACHYLLGRYLHRTGRREEALASYTRSAALRRARLAGQMGAAAVSAASGGVPAAIRRLAEAGWTARALAGTCLHAAQVLDELGRPDAALQRLDEALTLWPEYTEAERLRSALLGRPPSP